MRDAGADQLDEILAPCKREEFLASAWGKGFRHVRGRPGKFAALLPWERLNEILRRHRLDFPRLRLMRDGKRVPPEAYLRRTTNPRTQTTVPRLRPAGFTEQLRQGATLVLDAVDELHRPVEDLAAGLELFFRERVQANLYAGWHTSKGFDLHWDDHDVFILQVAGRKRWRVYGETRTAPVTGDNDVTPRPPADEPLWEETLEDGDLLYIPRGWWHVAFPVEEPTLHLTVGVHNRTGLDLLRWLTDRLKESASFRRDLPRLAGHEALLAHAARLRAELLAAWDDELIERYLRDYDAQAEPRPRLSLPWSTTLAGLPPGRAAVVRLLAPRPLAFTSREGVVEFDANRKRWRFAAAALLVLRPLAERRACTVAELCEAARGRLDERTVRLFLGELLRHGLVSVEEG